MDASLFGAIVELREKLSNKWMDSGWRMIIMKRGRYVAKLPTSK